MKPARQREIEIKRQGERDGFPLRLGHAIDVIEIFGLNIWRRILPGSDEMPASETGIPCGWHQRKQARRRGTNVKEEARFYVEWIDPAARSTLAAAHSACNRPPRGISRLHRDVVTYAAQPAAVNSKGDSSPPLRSRKKVRRRDGWISESRRYMRSSKSVGISVARRS